MTSIKPLRTNFEVQEQKLKEGKAVSVIPMGLIYETRWICVYCKSRDRAKSVSLCQFFGTTERCQDPNASGIEILSYTYQDDSFIVLVDIVQWRTSSHDRFRPCLRDSSDGIVQIHQKLMKTITTSNNWRATVLIVLFKLRKWSSQDAFRPCLGDSSVEFHLSYIEISRGYYS